ncbi:MAG TPA: cyclic nucleotide-binding domain-containing protein [Patescibacteria group bacterium]|nr:cyclic nucleotide-binding domain-containing protein [Patescibacteria group bacterium]
MPPFDLVAERDKGESAGLPCAQCEQGDLAFCAGLSSEHVRRLVSILGQVQVEPNTTVFREGDPAQHLYSIGTGAVKLYKLLSDGRRQITAFLFAGDFFGLSMHGVYAYTAEAMTPVHLCRFPRRKLEALFDEVPKLEKRLLGATIHELASAHEQMLLLGRKTAREKVATFLVTLWARLVGDGEQPAQITLPMSRSDIADYLGLTIETVSRTLTVFKREALITLPDANHVAIKQHDALARIAEGS